jgi:type II secretory pathway pseudopilin PulG
MAGSVISGQTISRTGRYRIFPIIGTALMVVGLFLFSLIGADTPLWQTALIMPIVGLGLGGNMQPIILATQNAVSPREIGVATSSVTFFRQMGGTLGTAVFLSVLLTNLPGKIADAFRGVQGTPQFSAALAAHPDQAATLQAAGQGNTDLNDTSFISRLDPIIAHPFKVGFSDSMSIVFLMGAAIMLVGLIVVLLLPEIPLADRSASQARAAEASENAARAAEADAAGPAAPPVAVSALADGAVAAGSSADLHGLSPHGDGAAAGRVGSSGNGSSGNGSPGNGSSGNGSSADPYASSANGDGAAAGEVRLDPDADERGRHVADGHDGEVRVPVDGHSGEGRHEATDEDQPEPAAGRPSAGT